MSMMNGVTTGLDLELGGLNLTQWHEREAGQWPMNYGQAVSHEMARMVADIVIFDADTVREGSSHKPGEQGLPPHGLPPVIVNGVIVKRDGKATREFPGLPVRYPVDPR